MSIQTKRIVGVLRKIVKGCILLVLCGFLANVLVTGANDWKMPVATHPEEIMAIWGAENFGVSVFNGPEDYEQDRWRQAMSQEMHFLIFADRIAISLAWIAPKHIPPWLWSFFEIINLPIGMEGIVSIGDIMMWSGTIVGLLAIIFLVLISLLKKR